MSETASENLIFRLRKGPPRYPQPTELELEAANLIESQVAEIERLQNDCDEGRKLLKAAMGEHEYLRRQLAEAERQRDQAASATCGPMTGEQLLNLWLTAANEETTGEPGKTIKGEKYAWNALAAHIWPNAQPQPDRREQLRQQVKRTDHGDRVVIVELNETAAIVQHSASGWWWSCPGKYGCSRDKPKDDAITAATEWLIDEALKGEGESC